MELNVPEPAIRLQETVPVGVTAVPASVSVTVAVQVVGPFTRTVEGLQLTVVVVALLLAVKSKVPELGAKFPPPPPVAVIRVPPSWPRLCV